MTFAHTLTPADWPLGGGPAGAVSRSLSICVPEGYRARAPSTAREQAWEPDEGPTFTDAAAAGANARKPRITVSLSRALLEVAASEPRALADTHFDAADATITRSPRGVEVLVRPSGGAAMFLFAFERLESTPEVGARCVVGWSAAKGDASPPTAYVATARSICASLRAW